MYFVIFNVQVMTILNFIFREFVNGEGVAKDARKDLPLLSIRTLALSDRVRYESKLNSLYRKFSSADLHSQSPRLALLRV